MRNRNHVEDGSWKYLGSPYCPDCGVYMEYGEVCLPCIRQHFVKLHEPPPSRTSVADMLGGVRRASTLERPSAEAWAAACNLRRRGEYYVGACPLCREGDDRFFVHADTAIVSCRICYDGRRTWFRDAIEAAGL